jgi:hypothetical protein
MAPASYKRAEAVFLTVDSAKVSGVALCLPEYDSRNRIIGYDIDSLGETVNQSGRRVWAKYAVELAKDCDCPLIVVGEEWTPHGLSTATFASLCESWGKWLAAFEDVEVPTGQILRVAPNVWRDAVFGKRRPKTTEALKAYACLYVDKQLDQPRLSHNIAEALCIRVWAQHAGQVHAVLDGLKAPKAKAKAKAKRKKAA